MVICTVLVIISALTRDQQQPLVYIENMNTWFLTHTSPNKQKQRQSPINTTTKSAHTMMTLKWGGEAREKEGVWWRKEALWQEKGETTKQIKLHPNPASTPHQLSSSTFYFSLPYSAPSFSTHFAASLSTPPPPFHSFCQSLPLWADRQRQGGCCCACSLTLSAHKSLSTACMSPLLSSLPLLPPLVKEWRNPVTCQ